MTIFSPVAMRRLAMAIAGLGAVVWVVPPPMPRSEVATPVHTEPGVVPSGGERAAALLEFDDIVRRNVFVSERRPAPASPAPVPPESSSRALPALQLYGVARGPQGAVALIDADPTIPGAEIYRPGDRVAGYRLAGIDATSVLLEGPNGPRTLRLALREERLP